MRPAQNLCIPYRLPIDTRPHGAQVSPPACIRRRVNLSPSPRPDRQECLPYPGLYVIGAHGGAPTTQTAMGMIGVPFVGQAWGTIIPKHSYARTCCPAA